MWKYKFMHCAGFLLLCMTTFAPQTIENLRVHKLTLQHENLKLKSINKPSIGSVVEEIAFLVFKKISNMFNICTLKLQPSCKTVSLFES